MQTDFAPIAGRPLFVDLTMVTYGIYLEYLCMMALPSYLIYLCLYQMPSADKLAHYLLMNNVRYCEQAKRTYPWRIALYKITRTKASTFNFHYAVELNVGPWYWPRWRKISVSKAANASDFLKNVAPSQRSFILPAQRELNHVYIDGVRQTLHMGAFAISLMLLLNVFIVNIFF